MRSIFAINRSIFFDSELKLFNNFFTILFSAKYVCKTISDDLKHSKFNKMLLYSSEVSVGLLKNKNTNFNNMTGNFKIHKNTGSSVTNKKIKVINKFFYY